MDISVCMIVKNEAAVLRRTLQSLFNHVSEIIVVDTGSTDGTKDIAYQFTEKVYDFFWCDDFSAARNFSLEKANNDWVLIVDADEVVTSFNKNQVESYIVSNGDCVGRIKRINFMVDTTGEKRYTERVNRLFNRNYFKYEGIIHEQLVSKSGLSYPTIPVEIIVEHIGYTQEILKRTDKITRNIVLLERALNQSPEDTYLLYQLGKSYYMSKDFNRAVKYFKKALDLPLNFALEFVGDLVETYGYALINSGGYSEALGLRDYAKYYGSSADYLFLMGYIYMNNGMFSQAIENYTACLSIIDCKVEGVNSYLANYNIGVIYECLGELEKAKQHYLQCDQYSLALNRLVLINKGQS